MTEPTAFQTKQRHGCLTAYLVLAIIANSATALLYLFGAGAIKRGTPDMPDWSFPVLIVLVLFNLACAIALLQVEEVGFLGTCCLGRYYARCKPDNRFGPFVCYRWLSRRNPPLRRSSHRKREQRMAATRLK